MPSGSPERRQRLLVLNQYYWPGPESTAQLLTDLCEALAEELDVRVVTGVVRGRDDLPRTERRNGVEVVRVASTAFDRARLGLRGLNYLTYLASAALAGLRSPRPDAVLCMSDPPMVGDAGLLLARRFRAPLVVVSEDVFPEIAIALGRLDNPVLVGVLRRLIRFYLRRADRVVAIGETMRRRLEAKGTPPERIDVIPNWVDTNEILPSDSSSWVEEHGLAGRFLVMHSGNVGYAQDLPTLVDAAALLRDLEDLRVAIVGGGARRAALEAQASALGLASVRFLDYQPRERLSETLSAGHVHVVGLGAGLAGYVVPSRVYGVLAAGRPVIVAADEESETVALVREAGCGWTIPPGDPGALAAAIRDAHARRGELDALGARGREHVVAHYDREHALERYRELLRSVLAAGT